MNTQLEKFAIEYAKKRNYSISKLLGSGTDGTVWETSLKTAVKILSRREAYLLERECYKRLLRNNIFEIHGFSIPRLRGYDDNLLAIEMDIVQPPRILDFGKVRLDSPGDFSDQTMADWEQQYREIWEDHWPTIKRILSRLRAYHIYYSDPSPNNITPLNWNPDL